MKKIIFIIVVTGFTFIILAHKAKAQNEALDYVTIDPTLSAVNTNAVKASDRIKPDPGTVNIKAVRNFKRSFPEVTNENWYVINGFHYVTFYKGGMKNKIVYTKNGQLDYSLKFYEEKSLPSSVRSAIKSIYYDFTINNVFELGIRNKTIYIVQMFDSKTLKTLRVCDGEIEEIENYIKG